MTLLRRVDGDLVLAALRIGLAHLWLYSLWEFRAAGAMPESAWQPISLALGFSAMPSAGSFDALYAAATTSALLLLFGVGTSISGPATVAFGALVACTAMSFGKIMHDANGLLLVLFVLAFSRWGSRLSVDGRRSHREPRPATLVLAGVALWTCAFALALPYLSSGLLKIWHGQFLSPENFPRLLARFLVRSPERTTAELHVVQWLLEHPSAAHALAFVGVGLELGFSIGLLSRPLRIAAWTGALLFHAGNAVFLGIQFRQQTILCLYFLAAESALRFAGRPGQESRAAADGVVPWARPAAVLITCLALGYLVAAFPALDGGRARALVEPLHAVLLWRPPDALLFALALASALAAGFWVVIDFARRRRDGKTGS